MIKKYEIILVDATESLIEHPKKQKYFYSGKKKKHTLKNQVVVEKETYKVLGTCFSNGKRHDFRLFQGSKMHVHPETTIITKTF